VATKEVRRRWFLELEWRRNDDIPLAKGHTTRVMTRRIKKTMPLLSII